MTMLAIDVTAVRLSLQVALTAVLVSLPSAIAFGYLLAKHRFRGKFILQISLISPGPSSCGDWIFSAGCSGAQRAS